MENDNGRQYFGLYLDNAPLEQGAAQSKRILHDIGQTAQREGDSIDASMKKIGAAVAGYFAVSKLKEFAEKVATVRGEFQQLEISFNTMLGSKRQADELMSQLIKTAAITPFNMSDVANGAKQLLAYGTAADEVNETLTRLGDIAAGLSLPLNDLVYLYGTTMTQGRMFTQDLRQFMGRGIPLAEELAKQFGVTKDKVGELVTAGKVGAEEFKQAIWAMSNEGSKFGGLMEAQSKSITGQISNLEDAVEQMINDIGKQSEGVISDVLSGAGWVVEHYQAIAKAILPVIAAYGAYKAALMAVWAAQKIQAVGQTVVAFMQLTKYVTSAKDAMLLFNMATNANPIGLIAGVVAAAAAAFHLFNSEESKASETSQKFGEACSKATAEVRNLYGNIAAAPKGSKLYNDSMEELTRTVREYGFTIDDEKDKLTQLNSIRDDVIAKIEAEAAAREQANAIQTASDTLNAAISDAYSEFVEKFKDVGIDENFATAFKNVLPQELIDEMAGYKKQLVDIENSQMSLAEKTHAVNEVHRNMGAVYSQVRSILKDYLLACGVEEEQIEKLNIGTNDLVTALSEGAFAYNNSTTAAHRAAEAYAKQAAEATLAALKNDDLANNLGFGSEMAMRMSDKVKDLSAEIASLMGNYSDNFIQFTIGLTAQVDQATLQLLNAMGQKELAEYAKKAMANATRLRDLEELARKNGQNKRYFIRDNQGNALFADDWARRSGAASGIVDKRLQQEEQKKEKHETEAERKARKRAENAAKRKAEQERKEREREAKQIADQTAERNKAIQQYNESVAKANEQAELDIRQRHIESMEEGFDKELEQIKLNYDRLKAENNRREQEMLEALADNKLNEWLNKHPKATKQQQLDYRSSLTDGNSDSRLTRTDLTPDQRKLLEEYEKVAIKIREKATRDLYKRLLDEYQDYNTRRQNEDKEYAKNRKALEEAPIDPAQREAALAELERKHKKAIQDINNEEVEAMQKSSTLLVDLFSDAAEKSDKQIRKLITDTQELLNYLRNTKTEDITPQFGFTAEQLQSLKSSPEQIKAMQEQVKKLLEIVRGNNPFKALAEDIKSLFSAPKEGEEKQSVEARLKKLSSSAAECADIIGNVTSKLADMFDAAGMGGASEAMESITDVMNTVSNIGKGFAEGGLIGGIAAAAGEAIGYVTKAFQANARHKAALKEVLKEVTAQQRAYTLALLEENLAMERAATIFGNLDYSRAANAVYVMRDAYAALSAEIQGTEEQQAKFAKRQTGSWLDAFLNSAYSAQKDAYSGLADISIKTGHKKTGLFGWGKGKDLYSSILDVYPELIDGQGKFNTELAKTILETREFEGEGKEALQYMIDLAEQAEAAYNQVKDYLTGIFGDLGNTMSDALVDAFRNGTDAAEAFGNSVADMLENLGRQMIFSTLFGSLIQNANDAMLDVMTDVSKTEEQKFNEYINILDQMTTGILGQQDNYNALMERYKQMAADKGVTIFDDDTTSREASQKGLASASQDSIDELNGRMTAVQGHTFSISQNTEILVGTTAAILRSVMGIERNTDPLPESLSAIERNMGTMEQSMRTVRETVSDIALKGVKIKA